MDIWSLELVIFEFAFGLPKQRGQFDPGQWYKRLIRAVEDWDSDDLIDFLRDRMLKMDYQKRLSASDCMKEVSNIHSAMVLTQNPEIESEAPTEKISTSLLMRYLKGIEEMETQINYSLNRKTSINCATIAIKVMTFSLLQQIVMTANG